MVLLTEEHEVALIDRFNLEINKYYDYVFKKYDEYSKDPCAREKLRILASQNPYLKKLGRLRKDTKREKIQKLRARLCELLDNSDNDISKLFTPKEKEFIYTYSIEKTRGLYKHAQAYKTGFCNQQIITGYSEEGSISVCFSKNTLEGTDQWLHRLMKELDHRFPKVKLDDKVMVINSKKDVLNGSILEGNATHCKNYSEAWQLLKRPTNQFKIIFMCSNNTRISNVLELCEDFMNLREGYRKLRIFHDEAHNTKEGIPAHRAVIENIIIKPNVISYQPITASKNSICDEENPLWLNENLEKFAVDFTDFDQTKSNDPKYSSIQEAKYIRFEKYVDNGWQDYGITSVSRDEFITVTDEYKDKEPESFTEDDYRDIDRRRELEFCQFMRSNKEIQAMNNGINCLNLNTIRGRELFQPGKFNIHIMSTPNRKVISYKLAKIAVTMPYKPNVLGIYGNQGNKFHLFTPENPNCVSVDKYMGEGEFNEKLHRLLEHMKTNEMDVNRPFIIIGNYTPTGESLSFVNYKYGTIRSVIRLISTNMEEDYQTACRGNYMTTKFEEADPNWTKPKKYLIGPSSFINNAEEYENENDARIDGLNRTTLDDETRQVVLLPTSPKQDDKGTKSIPVKITVDLEDHRYPKLMKIATKSKRTPKEKADFMELLEEAIDDSESDFEFNDPTDKFKFSKYKLNQFRCYQSTSKTPEKGYWKFLNYKNHHETGSGFINDTSAHLPGMCEILTCADKYILRSETGEILEKNKKNTWWLSYKY